MALQATIERYFAAGAEAVGDHGAMMAFLALRNELTEGRLRAAEPDPETSTGWRVNPWVKQGILLGFRLGKLEKMGGHAVSFIDKSTHPMTRCGLPEGVRSVPGGSAVRERAFLARH